MIIQSTIDTLKAMRFSAMAGELEKQLSDPATYNDPLDMLQQELCDHYEQILREHGLL